MQLALPPAINRGDDGDTAATRITEGIAVYAAFVRLGSHPGLICSPSPTLGQGRVRVTA
ncbi:hypothetical protein [Arthrobacter sp. GAS37]|uniref:hypothetical protein n=1 Tax=Arthrobacter sp. GAS37 TaxID=3156261 RepID=UPI00384F1118